MTCEVCEGSGAIWLGACELDACPRCCALAEAAWQSRAKPARKAALRLVPKEKAA